MLDKINCCNLALIAFLGNIVQLVFFFNYSLKIKDKNIELEKQEEKNNNRIKELEKKNGHELEEIRKLKGEIRVLREEQNRQQRIIAYGKTEIIEPEDKDGPDKDDN